MKNFKQGQKVVFTTKHLRLGFDIRSLAESDGFLWPQENEICTIFGRSQNFEGRWFLEEYLEGKDGCFFQGYSDTVLFPLEQVSSQLTDQITTDIENSFYLIESTQKHK